jgi:membrane-associated phospholipid phosphatase
MTTTAALVGRSPATSEMPALGRLTRRLEHLHPAVASLAVLVCSYAVLVAVFGTVGIVLIKVLVHDGHNSWDEIGVNSWFADHFTTGVERWSGLGSHLAETLTVVAIAAVIVAVLFATKHWRPALFIVSALVLEVSVFLTMTLLVQRDRPAVPKPDQVPPTSSYPSGHTAAAVALYVGIAVLVACLVRRPLFRGLVVLAGLLLPIAVGMSRIARGMHHPSDVMAGLALGALCLVAAGLVVTVATRASEERRTEPSREVAR